MYRLVFVFIGLLILEDISSSVLPETENKSDNLSNDDTHTDKEEKSSEKEEKHSRKRHTDKKSGDLTDVSASLESVVQAIGSGVKKFMGGKTQPDIVDTIVKSLANFSKNADPVYRTHEPEIFHFRSDKPSVMFEVNSKSIINVLKELLQSKAVIKYLDKFSKDAAVIYRAVKKEMDKKQSQPQRERSHHRSVLPH